MSLIEILRKHQPLPFVEYMQHVLYTPEFGYYSSRLPKLGKEGDFITAPELTPLFGYTLAYQFDAVLKAVENPCILEFGAGSGRLCVDVLTALEKTGSLPEQYFIIELSAALRLRQEHVIKKELSSTLANKVRWLQRWPETPFNGVILANEVLDAMPVHRFMKVNDEILESMIYVDDDKHVSEQFQPSQNERLIQYLNTVLPELPEPYLSEANLYIDGWLNECYQCLEKGVLFLFDYGFPRNEYYHPDRNQGTIMCHYQHQAHCDFLNRPGEQDITAHVDFTHVAEAGYDAGFHVAGYTSQASFLLANGLLNFLTEIKDERMLIQTNQAVKQLLQPGEMGELFKVVALSKGLELNLEGFQLQDRRVSL